MQNKLVKKVMVTTIAVTASISMFASSALAATSFSDIEEGQSHYDSITALASAGIIQGYPDGTYGTNAELQRRHGAVLYQLSLNLPVPSDFGSVLQQYYSDVDETMDYADKIAAVTPSIFSGAGGKFMPIKNMTREQMATTMVKALDLQDNGNSVDVNLANVDASHKDNVKIFAQYGITNQLDDFRPKEAVKRGQFATFLQKSLLAATPHSVTVNEGLTIFDRVVEVTLDVSEPESYKVYVDGEELAYKSGKYVGVVNVTSEEEVNKSLVIIKK
ncbi:S-layer homology domain-containing protein [Aquibacillus albus]|uniref:SLH domain-containing protein n=1 Tax=Aquibacillus albus TaxID=1168171 RepID=A0ABS2MX28_9BACI|nr:S-layer homology domain-containing protein [Aquibacillus albus]MBM7570437.1 hypothetical protein [Aquibacillus albus]